MKPKLSARPMSRAEHEAETEARRLVELIEGALALVSIHSTAEVDALEGTADRIERASRDLSAALRELSRERRVVPETND